MLLHRFQHRRNRGESEAPNRGWAGLAAGFPRYVGSARGHLCVHRASPRALHPTATSTRAEARSEDRSPDDRGFRVGPRPHRRGVEHPHHISRSRHRRGLWLVAHPFSVPASSRRPEGRRSDARSLRTRSPAIASPWEGVCADRRRRTCPADLRTEVQSPRGSLRGPRTLSLPFRRVSPSAVRAFIPRVGGVSTVVQLLVLP